MSDSNSAGTLERIVTGLVGAAFAIRILDSNRPWYIRLGYGLVGFDLLARAWESQPLFSGSQDAGLLGRTLSAEKLDAGKLGKQTPLKFVEVKVRSIEERVSRVHEQMIQGTRDPKIYALAREVLSKKCGDNWCVPQKDNKAEAEALFYEVKQRVRYVWDPLDYDAFQTPAKTLHIRAGDCDDQASLLGALLRSIGLKVRSRVVRTIGNASWNHIYLIVQIPGGKSGMQWMPLDLTVDQPPGWEVPQHFVQEMKDFDVVETGGPKALAAPTATTSAPTPTQGNSF